MKGEGVELTQSEEEKGVAFTVYAVVFIGARVREDWYCCVCLDILFTADFADRLMEQRVVGEVQAVYTNDPWVQHQVCCACGCRYDEEP